MSDAGKGLSTMNKPSHDTRKEIANELGMSTGKVAQADKLNVEDKSRSVIK